MFRTTLAVSLLVLLAGCGGEAPDAAAGSGAALTEAECTLLFERALDQAVSASPDPTQKDQMRAFFEAGRSMTIASCREGELYDREAYDCVTKATAGTAASHACIEAANSR